MNQSEIGCAFSCHFSDSVTLNNNSQYLSKLNLVLNMQTMS